MSRRITQWPWISLVVFGLLFASNPGRGFLYTAFLSSDELGHNIARPLVLWTIAAILVIVLCEYVLRVWLRVRRGDG